MIGQSCTVMIITALLLSNSLPITASIPADWKPSYEQANLFYAPNGNVDYFPVMANGYMGYTVFDQNIFVGGVFNGDDGRNGHPVSHRVAIPIFVVEPSEFNGSTSTDKTWTGQALDILSGVFKKRTVQANGNVALEERWYAHSIHKNLLVHEMEFTNLGDSHHTVNLKMSQSFPSTELNVTVMSRNNTVIEITATTQYSESAETPLTKVVAVFTNAPRFVTVDAKSTNTLYLLTVIGTSLEDNENILRTAEKKFANFTGQVKSLLQSHTDGWAKRWDNGQIAIEGDFELAQAVNASLFALLSTGSPDWPYGFSPGGLTDGYKGHTFWDQESWMLPPLMLLDPDTVYAAFQYRLARIAGAAAKAEGNGYRGLQFPWESAFAGVETCKVNGTVSRWGEYELHISSDIVYAIQQQWQLTNDKSFLTKVHPIIRGVATFWASRAHLNDDGTYSINEVMGPDEYHYNINDSVFTNWGASQALSFGVQAAQILGLPNPDADLWTKIAKGLVILYDKESDFHPEYRSYTNETVKQADTVLLSYPFQYKMETPNTQYNDLIYYANHTDENGPAMTWAIFAIGMLESHHFDEAEGFFRRGYANIQEPFKVWAETPGGGCANFLTGSGGFLQSVAYGYTGFRITDAGLNILKMPLPQGVTSISIHSLHFQGCTLDVEFTENSVRFALIRLCPTIDLVVRTADGTTHEVSTNSISLPKQNMLLTSNK